MRWSRERVVFGWTLIVAAVGGTGCVTGISATRAAGENVVANAGRAAIPEPRPPDWGGAAVDASDEEPRTEPWPGTDGGRRPAHRFPYQPRRLTCAQAAEVARAAAPAGRLDPGLVFAVMRVESAFSTNVISRAGAVGLMQVMPDNVGRLGCGDLFEAAQNAACGVRVLRRFLDRYDGDLMLALSGYNAGLGMPGRARAETRTPTNLGYVEKVLRFRARFLRKGCAAFD